MPSTAAFDRATKLAVYAREGVGHAWLVDPLAQMIETLRLDSGRWTILSTHAGEGTMSAEPFETFALDLTLLWDEPPPDRRGDRG